MDDLVTRFDALHKRIEDDYNVYMTNLPAIQNAVDQTFIHDLSDIIHQYLQPTVKGEAFSN